MKTSAYLNWITNIVVANKSNLISGNNFINNSNRTNMSSVIVYCFILTILNIFIK